MIRVLFFGHTAAPANDASALKGLRAQAGLQVTVLDPGALPRSGLQPCRPGAAQADHAAGQPADAGHTAAPGRGRQMSF